MMKYIITNDQYDIYEIICHYYDCGKQIHDRQLSNRLLIWGEAARDLRCIMLSCCWDKNLELSKADIAAFDGRNEKTDDYIVKTLNQTQLEEMISSIPKVETNILQKYFPGSRYF